MTKRTLFIEKDMMVHFEGERFKVSGTLWGDHFNGLELEITKYGDNSIDVDVYLENRRGYILALHNLTKITYGLATLNYEDLKEV